MVTLRFVQAVAAAKVLALVACDLDIDAAGKRAENIDEMIDFGNRLEALYDAAFAVALCDSSSQDSVAVLLEEIVDCEGMSNLPQFGQLCLSLLNAPLDSTEFLVQPLPVGARRLRRQVRA